MGRFILEVGGEEHCCYGDCVLELLSPFEEGCESVEGEAVAAVDVLNAGVAASYLAMQGVELAIGGKAEVSDLIVAGTIELGVELRGELTELTELINLVHFCFGILFFN